MVQISYIQADVPDFRVVHPRGIQCDRPVLVSDVQVANLDALSCVSQSHVQRGCLVKGRDVAVEDCNVLFSGINVRFVA